MSSNTPFTKENLNQYLKALAKEYKKLVGKNMPAEIILIGGAAIIADYSFRKSTYDVDAIIIASSAMKDAINKVGDDFDLPSYWMNTDFEKTASYSPKLIEFSQYYRTYSNIVTIRTVTAEYLVAMKLKAGRQYKNDISDIAGIIQEQKALNKPLTYEAINNAVIKLYSSWDGISQLAIDDLKSILSSDNLSDLYSSIREKEINTKDLLVKFEKSHPNQLSQSNLDDVLKSLSPTNQKSADNKSK